MREKLLNKNRIFRFFILLTFSLGLASCYANMKVRFKSEADTNKGRPFYVMVKKADDKTYVTDTYQSVSKQLFAYPADPQVLYSKVIFPGKIEETLISKEGDLPIVFYFMFTEPGSKWRTMIQRPLPSEIEIDLGENQIRKVLIRKK